MVTCNGPSVRQWCVLNAYAVALVCGVNRHEKICDGVNGSLADTDVEIYATLAAGIHKTARALCNGDRWVELFNAVFNIMTNQNPPVCMSFLLHFRKLLTLLATGPNGAKKFQCQRLSSFVVDV